MYVKLYTLGVCLLLVAAVRDYEFCSFSNHYVSYSGFSPLHYAAIIDDRDMVERLLRHGADPTLQNGRGLTPSDYCTNEETKASLKEHVTKVRQLYIHSVYTCTCILPTMVSHLYMYMYVHVVWPICIQLAYYVPTKGSIAYYPN